MTAIAAPVVVAISCGNETDTEIILTSSNGMKFTVTNGVVTSIVVNGEGAANKVELIDKIKEGAEDAGVTLPTGADEGKIFGLINKDESTNIDSSINIDYYVEHPDHFSRTPSTHGTNPGTAAKTPVHIDGNELMNVDIDAETPAQLRVDFEKFRTLYNTASAKFAINLTNANDEVATMVFIMKPTTTRANSFREDTDSYPNFDVTLGSSNQHWSLNYGDPQAFDFFADDFEGAWIAKINSETSDTSDDVTQFDWSAP